VTYPKLYMAFDTTQAGVRANSSTRCNHHTSPTGETVSAFLPSLLCAYPDLLRRFCDLSLGPVDPGSVERVEVVISDEEKARRARFDARPPLSDVLNLHDFEVGISFFR
jgi:hypothetical protein